MHSRKADFQLWFDCLSPENTGILTRFNCRQTSCPIDGLSKLAVRTDGTPYELSLGSKGIARAFKTEIWIY